jgi:hypothetical protein
VNTSPGGTTIRRKNVGQIDLKEEANFSQVAVRVEIDRVSVVCGGYRHLG